MSTGWFSRALVSLAFVLSLNSQASQAALLSLEEALDGDLVTDPGEVEKTDLHLEELHDPAFSTPAKVAAYVEEKLGVAWETSDGVPNVVVVRNAGSGYRPSPSEAAYDDLFLVVTETKVYQFTHGNAEGTEHQTYVKKYGYNRYVDPNLGKAMTPALAPGPYRFLVGKHRDQYKALRLTTMDWKRDPLPSQRKNGRRGAFIVGAVNVHKGGSTWNWSVGCLTIHYARYQAFIDHFPMGKWGRFYLIGDWNGSYGGREKQVEARSVNRRELFEALAARAGLD